MKASATPKAQKKAPSTPSTPTPDPEPETTGPDVGSILPEEDDEDADPNLKHTEGTNRTVWRPYSQDEHLRWELQHVRATLKVRSLQERKKELTKTFNDKIGVLQDQAITAAEALQNGSAPHSVPVHCIWDNGTGTYYEATKDTREVLYQRPLRPDEILRFRQGVLPGHDQGRWLTAEEAVTHAPNTTASEVGEGPDEADDDDHGEDEGDIWDPDDQLMEDPDDDA